MNDVVDTGDGFPVRERPFSMLAEQREDKGLPREESIIDRHYRPAFARRFGRAMDAFTKMWFRYSVKDVDRIPKGPCLFVGNHSGIGIVDVLCVVGFWARQFDGKRRGVGMMHKMFITAPIVGWFARSFGAVPADPANAREALRLGYDVATFPGGDIDACRPLHQARDVFFGPRRGYIRLALDAKVPVVPLATIGSHYTYLLLPGGEWIARVTGMKTWARCARFPLVLGSVIAVLLAVLAFIHLTPWWLVAVAAVLQLIPNPVRVTSQILPAIDVTTATAHIKDPNERIEAAHALVHGTIARAVRDLRHSL